MCVLCICAFIRTRNCICEFIRTRNCKFICSYNPRSKRVLTIEKQPKFTKY